MIESFSGQFANFSNFAPCEVELWERVYPSVEHAYQSAKKWGTAALANFDFGVGNPRDVFDAVGVYGKMKAAHYQSIFDFQMARANLVYAIGDNPLPAQQ